MPQAAQFRFVFRCWPQVQHPAHQALVKLVVPILEDVLVVDYWATR